MKTTISIFQNKKVRKIWHQEERYFSVLDVIAVLTDSKNPKDYLKKMRKRDKELNFYMGTNCPPLVMSWETGKTRINTSANTEWLFRIIQSIPSPKVEPFKLRLAKVGHERIQEIDDPELAMERMRNLYQRKWYPQDRIQKRERGIAVRNTLTDERKQRGIKNGIEYAILTDEIYQATFGLSAQEYKDYKGLDKQNLRDHMNDLELIFNLLGEASTTEIMKVEDSIWFENIQKASKSGGEVAKVARQDLEKKTRRRIISKQNHLWEEEIEILPE